MLFIDFLLGCITLEDFIQEEDRSVRQSAVFLVSPSLLLGIWFLSLIYNLRGLVVLDDSRLIFSLHVHLGRTVELGLAVFPRAGDVISLTFRWDLLEGKAPTISIKNNLLTCRC